MAQVYLICDPSLSQYISAQDAHKAIIFLNGYRLQSKCIKVGTRIRHAR